MKFGLILGYPACCIRFFDNCFRLHRCSPMVYYRKMGIALPLRGTGYVPCPDCASKDEGDLREEIAQARLYSKPFPHAGNFGQCIEFGMWLRILEDH